MIIYDAPADIRKPEFDDFTTESKGFDYRSFDQAEEAYLEEVIAFAKKASGPSYKLAGEIVRRPVGDGAAIYVIGKFGGRTGLIHVATGDAWADPYFERTVTVAELTRMVEGAKNMKKLFAKSV